MDLWISFDELMRECLGRILGTPLLDQQWQQAQLPVSLGGLGLRAAVDHAPAILLHSALYTVSFYKALWTSGYTSRAIGWGNPLAGECVTLLSNSAVTIIEES